MNYLKQINYLRGKMAAARGLVKDAVAFFVKAGIVFAKAVRYALLCAKLKISS